MEDNKETLQGIYDIYEKNEKVREIFDQEFMQMLLLRDTNK